MFKTVSLCLKFLKGCMNKTSQLIENLARGPNFVKLVVYSGRVQSIAI